jgi:hypothetical protein
MCDCVIVSVWLHCAALLLLFLSPSSSSSSSSSLFSFSMAAIVRRTSHKHSFALLCFVAGLKLLLHFSRKHFFVAGLKLLFGRDVVIDPEPDFLYSDYPLNKVSRAVCLPCVCALSLLLLACVSHLFPALRFFSLTHSYTTTLHYATQSAHSTTEASTPNPRR